MMIITPMNISQNATPNFFCKEYLDSRITCMPPVISYTKEPDSYSIAMNIFPNMFHLSSQEREEYNKSIEQLYTITNIRIS